MQFILSIKTSLTLLFALLVFTLLSMILGVVDVRAAQTTRVTNNNYEDGYPQEQNGKVLWSTFNGGINAGENEIFLYDTQTGVTKLLASYFGDIRAKMDNGKVVWAGVDFTDGFPEHEIYLYDIASESTTQLTHNDSDDLNPTIGYGKVFWGGNIYDIATGTTTQMTAGGGLPVINEGKVISYGGNDVYLYDIETDISTRINGESTVFGNQSIYTTAEYAAWAGNDGNPDNDSEIYLYEIATGVITQITDNATNDLYPQIDDGKLVWSGDKVYLYDIESETTTPLTSSGYDYVYTSISGGKVAWFARGGNWGRNALFLYDINAGTTTFVRDNANFSKHQYPRFHDGKIAWTVDDGDYEIYLYDGSLPGLHAPAFLPIGDKTVNEGDLLEFTVTARDEDGDRVMYSAANLPQGATFDPETATFRWTPTFDQQGNHENIEFTATDDSSPIELDSELITITVGNVNRAPVFDQVTTTEVSANTQLRFTVHATDPDGDSFAYSVQNLPEGAVFNEQTGEFTWTPTLSQLGSHYVAFVATDDGSPNESGFLELSITVGNAPTPVEQAEDLVDEIIEIDVPPNVENAYLSNLKKVAIFIQEGKIQPAINQLNAFIQKVNQDYAAGIITQAVHDDLVSKAQALLADLQ